MITWYGKFLRQYLAQTAYAGPLDRTDKKFIVVFTVLFLLMLLTIGSCTAGVIS